MINAEGEVTHLLLNLEPGEFCMKSETDKLREHVRRLQCELAEARAETDAAKIMAKAAMADAETVRKQFNSMLAIVTSSAPDEDDAGSCFPDDDMMVDGWDSAPQQGLGGHHVMQMMASQKHSEGHLDSTTQASIYGASRKRMHLDVIEAPLVQGFSNKFEQDRVKTGFALCDSVGAILWSNTLFSEATGYAKEQVVGCQWHTFLCGAQTDGSEVSRVRTMMQMCLPLSS